MNRLNMCFRFKVRHAELPVVHITASESPNLLTSSVNPLRASLKEGNRAMQVTLEKEEPLTVAIVGGGIVGLILTIGLLKQNVKGAVYEQAQGFREIGAGIAFTANAIRCMESIDPDIVTALRSSGSVATSDSNGADPNDYLRWIDGYNQLNQNDPHHQRMLYKINAGHRGFEECRRDQFLESLVKLIPRELVHYGKRLETAEEPTEGRVQLKFVDGSVAEADAGILTTLVRVQFGSSANLSPDLVIGCDGINSRTRAVLLGADHPACNPGYTHKVAYRTLIPMGDAVAALGEYKAQNQQNHVGPHAHLIHYPVAGNKFINPTAFISDLCDWKDEKMVTEGKKEDLISAFANWNLCVRNVVSLFPEKLEKWAVFDMWEYPAPRYNKGRICVAGDAAHASSPHHGAGACIGVEDCLCLTNLFGEISRAVGQPPTQKSQGIRTAFEVYNDVRRTRSQWLVNSSRRVCDFYHQPEWAEESKWIKAETCFEELKDRSYKIWNFDYTSMIEETIQGYRKKMAAKNNLGSQLGEFES